MKHTILCGYATTRVSASNDYGVGMLQNSWMMILQCWHLWFFSPETRAGRKECKKACSTQQTTRTEFTIQRRNSFFARILNSRLLENDYIIVVLVFISEKGDCWVVKFVHVGHTFHILSFVSSVFAQLKNQRSTASWKLSKKLLLY